MLRARTQLSRCRMHDLIFLFDADGERFVGAHKLIVARRSAQGHDLWSSSRLNGLHLTDKGYQVWADAMEPILIEWLGPPSQR
jgi:lysophospholipase L1-like esterase